MPRVLSSVLRLPVLSYDMYGVPLSSAVNLFIGRLARAEGDVLASPLPFIAFVFLCFIYAARLPQ